MGPAGFSRVVFLFSAEDAMTMAFEHDTKAAGFSVRELLSSGALESLVQEVGNIIQWGCAN